MSQSLSASPAPRALTWGNCSHYLARLLEVHAAGGYLDQDGRVLSEIEVALGQGRRPLLFIERIESGSILWLEIA